MRLLAEFSHRREHAMDESGIIGVIHLGAIERHRRDAALIEAPQDWIGGHGRSTPSTFRDSR
jgi:hypothetical protein